MIIPNMNDQINLAAIAALEDAEFQAQGRRRVYHYNDPLEELTENQFVNIYRLTPDIMRDLIQQLEPFIMEPTRLSSLSVSRKVNGNKI